MQNFSKHFVREGPGRWACVEPATVELPTGRIQVAPGTKLTRGKTFMGVELAKLLDEYYASATRLDPRTEPQHAKTD